MAAALVASGKLRTFDCLRALEELHKVVPERLLAAASFPASAPARSRSVASASWDGETADREIADREMNSRCLADRAMGSPKVGPVSSAISLAGYSWETALGNCLRDCLATACINQGWLVPAVPPSGNRAVTQAVPEGNPGVSVRKP